MNDKNAANHRRDTREILPAAQFAGNHEIGGEDRELNQTREDVTIYTNYQPKNGVLMPMQVTRERDGRRISQVFYDDCRLNPSLPQDFFTRAGLEKEAGKGK